MRLLTRQIARRAEVDQLQAAVRLHHDVVGGNVAVDDPRAVHLFERAHQRQKSADQRFRVKGTVLPHALEKRLAVDILHDHVGGVVFAEKVADNDDAAFPGEPREMLRLLQKALFAVVVVASLGGEGGRDLVGDGVAAVGKARGEVFLDGNVNLQQLVEALVGDAEAALAQ